MWRAAQDNGTSMSQLPFSITQHSAWKRPPGSSSPGCEWSAAHEVPPSQQDLQDTSTSSLGKVLKTTPARQRHRDSQDRDAQWSYRLTLNTSQLCCSTCACTEPQCNDFPLNYLHFPLNYLARGCTELIQVLLWHTAGVWNNEGLIFHWISWITWNY